MRNIHIYFLALLSLLAGVAMPATAATIVGGQTNVTLASSFITSISTLGLSVAPLGSASVTTVSGSTVVTFPITGGTVDDATGDALIEHVGSGLAFSDSTTTFSIGDFLIDTNAATIFGLDGSGLGLVPLFLIDSSLNLTLSSNAAASLAATFAGAPDLTGVTVGTATTSPATAPIPEPQTWMMLLFGFGAAGAVIRRRRAIASVLV